MSKLSELVEAEALAAEADDDDDEDDQEPEPEPEPEDDEEEVEARGPSEADLRKLEQEHARHEKALAKVIGADWPDFAPCGVCDGVGYVPAATNVNVPFERDPQTEPCSACNGYGTTLTGAREPGMVTRACSKCQGSGWTTVSEYPEVQPLALAPQATEQASVENGAPAPPVDPAVEALRARGYVVVEPVVSAPAPGA